MNDFMISQTSFRLVFHRLSMDLKHNRRNINKLKHISPDDMTKEQLMVRVRQLEQHVTNLKNVIAKGETRQQDPDGKNKRRNTKPKKTFDFNKYNTRHVAMKVAYLGWDYGGYVVQEDTSNTIENKLFEALITTRLIESRETSNYHRCGRTDKGVSAFSQVVSLDLRTNLLEGKSVKIREGGTAIERSSPDPAKEIQYCKMLNAILPDDIKVLSWCPVDTEFSARFDCIERTYKYYFPRVTLNIQAMQTAATKLVGHHDFRNLCKMDVGNGVTAFIRDFRHASVKVLDDRPEGAPDPYSICELTIVGNAFLWHQIRCIVAVLLMVGQGKENPEIIDELLDVKNHPSKPQYQMASELPLVLFDCQYEGTDWMIDKESHIQVLESLQKKWTESAVKTALLRSLLGEVETAKVMGDNQVMQQWSEGHPPINSQLEVLTVETSKVHRPLLQREVCGSLEERIEYFAKRRKREIETLAATSTSQGDSLPQRMSSDHTSGPVSIDGNLVQVIGTEGQPGKCVSRATTVQCSDSNNVADVEETSQSPSEIDTKTKEQVLQCEHEMDTEHYVNNS